VAKSSSVFILGRAVTGIGIAAGFPLCTTILIDITTPVERPIYMASCVGIDVISLAFGALLGGFFDTTIDYRWAFAVTILGSILYVSIIVLAYEQPRRDSLPMALYIRQFDFIGLFLFLAFSLTLLIGIQLAAQKNNWTAMPVIILLALAATSLSCFVFQQRNGHPTNRFLPRGLFTRDVVLLLGFGFFVLFAMYGVYYYLSTWFQTVKGLSSFDAAVWLLAFFLSSGLSRLVHIVPNHL
jgi:predicted MFS family arabinose efflux permease